ncbi:peptidoglycan-binding protein [Novosphingobium percolationis]|uniref:peptidoglycan-binding protein n=1 Tax=Novosphingobium percolationis TaxID=2871811 RepID=UPI001CD41486|nr:peptidoglycan-binding domain-containing protein [Novosphingobium percolationis]MCH7629340.1 peptidoglycan-binding protein [Pseudomonadota bacterium]
MRAGRATIAFSGVVAGLACLSGAALRAAPPPTSTAASPMLEQATPPVDSAPHDEDSRWPTEARQPSPAAASPTTEGDDVSPTASVSIAAAATAAADGVETPPLASSASSRALAAPAPPIAPVAASAARDPGAQFGASVDPAMLRRIAERLVAMGFLGTSEDAGDPVALSDAVRAFQQARGIAPTGTLDRDTIGQLLS